MGDQIAHQRVDDVRINSHTRAVTAIAHAAAFRMPSIAFRGHGWHSRPV
jgi:hypothetical protein